MKLKSSIIALSFAVALVWVLPAWAQSSEGEHEYHDRESCVSARQERQNLCDQAAKLCFEVHEYEAFNKIRPCAHYAQRCHKAGKQQEAVCFPEANPRVTGNPSTQSLN
ncbi:MAG: hypothetical protein R3257_00610 [bacterium]|nr:hypothetical protein [bacterium]